MIAPWLRTPVECTDLKHEIAWDSSDPFAGIQRFFNSGYVMEEKMDGCQLVLYLGEERNTILSRGRDVSDHFPVLKYATIPGAQGTTFVGELIADGASGPVLASATTLLVSSAANAVAIQNKYGAAHLVLFDIIDLGLGVRPENYDGPVTDLSYTSRRVLLETIAPHLAEASTSTIEIVPQYPSTAATIKDVLDRAGEGVVIKNIASPYTPGNRSASGWYKVKRYSTADAFIIDWKPGKGSNKGLVGSLILGVMKDGLVTEVATVGNFPLTPGPGQITRKEITSPDGGLKGEWYGQVIEFMGQALGVHDKVRHPHMVRVRWDKKPEQCTWEAMEEVFARA